MDPQRMSRRRVPAARLVLALYLVVVGLVVFLPAPEAQPVTGIVGWLAHLVGRLGVPVLGAYVVLEFVANIVMFVPFGVLVAVSFPRLRVWAVVLLGFAASVGIELVQLLLPTRFATVSDVIANTAGAAIGCLVVAALRSRAARARLANPTEPARSPT